jgi:nicotinamidase-related amidase
MDQDSLSFDDVARSPELMNIADTALLVVDTQEKLLNVVAERGRIEWNIRRLLDAAGALGIPRAAVEQNPDKLGATPVEIAKRLPPPVEKMTFSGAACCPWLDDLRAAGHHRILVCGIETHVCVAQTAFDLAAAGWLVYVAADAVGARYAFDHEIALRRMESAGVILTTTEAAMFEWCRVADRPEFKQISALAKEKPPT